MGVRGVVVNVAALRSCADARTVLRAIQARMPVGLVTEDGEEGNLVEFTPDVVLTPASVGVAQTDPRFFTMVAAGLGCHPNEIVGVGPDPIADVQAAQRVGGRGIWFDRSGQDLPRGVHPDAEIVDLSDLPAVLDRFVADDDAETAANGVGAHPEPWPTEEHYDPVLLAGGDRRNVIDRYRYWREDAIAADLAADRHAFHVAVENWRRDRNIGTVIRNANGFGTAAFHVIGARRWNRRGAMATDRYLTEHHHETVEDFVEWARRHELAIVAVDNVAGSEPIETADLPERCVLVFGQEGPGLTDAVLHHADLVVHITQYGSTRSLNAGVAAGIAMYAWVRRHG